MSTGAADLVAVFVHWSVPAECGSLLRLQKEKDLIDAKAESVWSDWVFLDVFYLNSNSIVAVSELALG